MKVARTVLNGESGSNAADLHNERDSCISRLEAKIAAKNAGDYILHLLALKT